jgi:hypothetical protein
MPSGRYEILNHHLILFLMKRFILFIIAGAALASCTKTQENIIWEKSFGHGKALFVAATGDTGLVSCGEMDGKQYLLFLDEDKNKVMEYKSEYKGLLNDAWTGENYFITAGSAGGKMYLAKIDSTGTEVWDSVFNTAFRVDNTSLCYLGGGEFLAVGSVNPDTANAGQPGLSFVWFNNNGIVSQKKDSLYTSYIAAMDAVTDNAGNIYLATSRQNGSSTMATVTKYTSYLYKQWEKPISNNPSFGAASLSIILDGPDNPIVTGRTELQVPTGKEDNTFAARYFFSIPKDSIKREYLEYASSGTSVIKDGAGQYLVLNSSCNIINILDQDFKPAGIIRTYNSCDSQGTDIFGYSIALDPSGNILIAGTKGGGYYLALKSSTALSPL